MFFSPCVLHGPFVVAWFRSGRSCVCPRSFARRTASSNQLSGSLPKSLGSMSYLKYLCVVALSVSASTCGTATAQSFAAVAFLRLLASSTARSLRGCSVTSTCAQVHELQLAVGPASELGGAVLFAHQCVRCRPLRECVNPRGSAAALSTAATVFLFSWRAAPLLRCMTARYCAVGAHACAFDHARAGTWTPTSCRARCPARWGCRLI